ADPALCAALSLSPPQAAASTGQEQWPMSRLSWVRDKQMPLLPALREGFPFSLVPSHTCESLSQFFSDSLPDVPFHWRLASGGARTPPPFAEPSLWCSGSNVSPNKLAEFRLTIS